MTPNCQNCPVIKLLKEFSKEYEDFLVFVRSHDFRLAPDHARGYSRGQITLATDVIDDVDKLIEYLKTKVEFEAKGVRVL